MRRSTYEGVFALPNPASYKPERDKSGYLPVSAIARSAMQLIQGVVDGFHPTSCCSSDFLTVQFPNTVPYSVTYTLSDTLNCIFRRVHLPTGDALWVVVVLHLRNGLKSLRQHSLLGSRNKKTKQTKKTPALFCLFRFFLGFASQKELTRSPRALGQRFRGWAAFSPVPYHLRLR
jgi:hypothetical protein